MGLSCSSTRCHAPPVRPAVTRSRWAGHPAVKASPLRVAERPLYACDTKALREAATGAFKSPLSSAGISHQFSLRKGARRDSHSPAVDGTRLPSIRLSNLTLSSQPHAAAHRLLSVSITPGGPWEYQPTKLDLLALDDWPHPSVLIDRGAVLNGKQLVTQSDSDGAGLPVAD